MGRSVRLLTITCGLLLVAAAGAPAAGSGPGIDGVEAEAMAPVRVLLGEHPFGMALALDPAGHRHIVAADRQGDLWYATDRSGGWTAKVVLAGPGHEVPEWAWTEPAVAIDTDGSIHVAVVRSTTMDTPGSTSGVHYLTDKGRAPGDFGPRSKVTGDMMASPSLRVVDGVRYLAYVKCACYPGQETAPLYFKTDRGGSWRTERLDDWAYAPSMRVAGDGRAHIAYEDQNGLRYTRARSKVGDFTTPARIPGSKGNGGTPSLALDSADQAHVVWPAWNHHGQPVLYVKRTPSGWSSPRQLGVGWAAELSIDVLGRPHVVIARGYDRGTIVHRWLASGAWQQSTISSGEGSAAVTIRAFGKRATIAWSQYTKPRGIWVTRD
jgi:hypothetical protein